MNNDYAKGLEVGLSMIEQIMNRGVTQDTLLNMYNYIIGEINYVNQKEEK